MSLHSENTKENYFAKKIESLAKESAAPIVRNERMSFIDLKIMEFWSRFMRYYPDGDCRVFCDKYMTDECVATFLDRVYEARESIELPTGITTEIEDKWYKAKDLLEEFHKSRRIIFARHFLDFVAHWGDGDVYTRLLLSRSVQECSANWLAGGCDESDVSMQRAFELKRLFHLSDEALDLVLYL